MHSKEQVRRVLISLRKMRASEMRKKMKEIQTKVNEENLQKVKKVKRMIEL